MVQRQVPGHRCVPLMVDFLWIFFEMRIVSLLGSNKCSGTCRSSGGLWSSSSGACSRSLGDCSQGFHLKRDSRGNQVINSSEAWLCRKGIGDRQIDLVLSDMAPSNPGMASVNHDMTLRLVYSVLEVIPVHCPFIYFVCIPVLCTYSCAWIRSSCEDFCRIWSW